MNQNKKKLRKNKDESQQKKKRLCIVEQKVKEVEALTNLTARDLKIHLEVKRELERMGLKPIVVSGFGKDGLTEEFVKGILASIPHEPSRKEVETKVNEMIEVCRKGPKHSQIKRLDILDEKLQDFKEFKILKI